VQATRQGNSECEKKGAASRHTVVVLTSQMCNCNAPRIEVFRARSRGAGSTLWL
jgi:hypothetical protein